MNKETKAVVCKICGFIFEAPKSMKEFYGCYTPTYCDQKQKIKEGVSS